MTKGQNGYNEYAPPASLQLFLDCYWSYSSDATTISPNEKPIIPDGCIDIIFDVDHQSALKSFVVGAMTKPIWNSSTNLVGVRFKPGMAYPFINTPIYEFTDSIVDYFEFVGQEANDLSNQLISLNSIKYQIALLNKIFGKKLSAVNAVEPRMSQALDLIMKTEGRYSVKQISDMVGWSRQHFTRKCLCYTGLTPKFLNQVTRIRKVIKLYKTERFYNWSQLAVDGSYYDQAHMINEFKKITGFTPKNLLS